MFDSRLPKTMWDVATSTAIHTYNRTPHKLINYETPLRKFAPYTKCHLNKIRRFGCIEFFIVSKIVIKFDETAISTILVDL